MDAFSGLNPRPLWKYFGEILSIPRLSKHEGEISDYLMDFAGRNALEYIRDRAGNILIRKEASRGLEGIKTVILQSHLDMVGEKETGSTHDFMKDPIIPVREGEWITARGTTLGADDGIGIAAQMMILAEDTIDHGPLECLFTMDEESGMTGARLLETGFLEGSVLLNLDSEDWGEIFIGCAGGVDTIGNFHFRVRPSEKGCLGLQINVSGLKGGHSGDEIHRSHANAIKILAGILQNTITTLDAGLSKLEGGNLRNAIPRDASAVICLRSDHFRDFAKTFSTEKSRMIHELSGHEPGLNIDLGEVPVPDNILDADQQTRFLQALIDCPHGVIGWSRDIENLVETSTNLASVRFNGFGSAQVITSQRSSIETEKNRIAGRIATVLKEAGAETEHTEGYPGWAPNLNSELLGIVSSVYRELFRKEPVARVIHAGLECGLILQKYPDLDMVSIGPDIRGAHTPEERIHIASTEEFWSLLTEVLKRVPYRE